MLVTLLTPIPSVRARAIGRWNERPRYPRPDLYPRVEAEFVADVLDVPFCGAEGDREALRDLGIRHPLRNELRDLGLPAAQHRRVPRPGLTFPSRHVRPRNGERKFPTRGPPTERGEVPLGIGALPVRESRSHLLDRGRTIAGPPAPQKQIGAFEPRDRERERQIALREERLDFREQGQRALEVVLTIRSAGLREQACGPQCSRLASGRVTTHQGGPTLHGGDISEALCGEQREDRDRSEIASK